MSARDAARRLQPTSEATPELPESGSVAEGAFVVRVGLEKLYRDAKLFGPTGGPASFNR